MSRLIRATRPKKLNTKQNVPIFRETQVELIDSDPTRTDIDTGVEKAEANVSRSPTCTVGFTGTPGKGVSRHTFVPKSCQATAHANNKQRNIICNRQSKLLPASKQRMHTFQLRQQSQATFSMTSYTRSGFSSRPHTSGRHRRSRTVPALHIAWTRTMKPPLCRSIALFLKV